MNIFNDLIYMTSIQDKQLSFLKTLYKASSKKTLESLNQILDYDLRNILLEGIGERGYTDSGIVERTKILQYLMTLSFQLWNKYITRESIDYLAKRNISEQDIKDYLICDTKVFENPENLIDFIKETYKYATDSPIFEKVRKEFLHCIFDYISTSKKIFGSSHGIIFPNTENNMVKGFVIKSANYVKPEIQKGKNFYKFLNPFSYSYMFNSQAILEYDELILVEAVTDAINLINAGYKNTISVSMTRLSDKHLELLKGKKLKVIFDKDYGGLQGLKDIKSRKREEELIYLSLLPMQKDFDELTEKEIHQVMEMIPNYNILGIIRDGGFLKDLLNIEKEWTKKK